MHEYSIIASLMELCEKHAKEQNAHKITKVVVALGERSGVNADLFQSAFENYKEGGICEASILEIKKIPVKMRCRVCGFLFIAQNLQYGYCTQCNSQEVAILEGTELTLLSLELETE